jgi:nicotinamide mononucleotide transporter
MKSLMLFLEIFSVSFSLLFILGIALKKVWAWPFGILASALASILFYLLQLYSEMYLNVFYGIAGFYGWWRWKFVSTSKADNETDIIDIKPKSHFILVLFGGLFMLLTGYVFSNFSDASFPYIDAFTSSFGIIATFMEARKILSGWYYWIVVNGVSVWLYFQKEIYIYTGLGIVFLLLSFWGLYKWGKEYYKP